MRVFLDFEASSLGRHSYPIEVAWVFEEGGGESHLIRPAANWTDWDRRSEAIHRIPRATLVAEGTPHAAVAARMVAALEGHVLLASAPSWDGKWLSALLRAAGLPRHTLRLGDTKAAQREAAAAELAGVLPRDTTAATVDAIVTAETERHRLAPAAHRALADAEGERRLFDAIVAAARAHAANGGTCEAGDR